MERKWIISGLLLLITGIILGAFGAHALKELIAEERLISYETGVRYQLLHAVAFLIVPFVAGRFQLNTKWSFRLLLMGVCFFSFSIYLLAMKDVWHLESVAKILGPITPVGGLLLILGWTLLLVQLIRKK